MLKKKLIKVEILCEASDLFDLFDLLKGQSFRIDVKGTFSDDEKITKRSIDDPKDHYHLLSHVVKNIEGNLTRAKFIMAGSMDLLNYGLDNGYLVEHKIGIDTTAKYREAKDHQKIKVSNQTTKDRRHQDCVRVSIRINTADFTLHHFMYEAWELCFTLAYSREIWKYGLSAGLIKGDGQGLFNYNG